MAAVTAALVATVAMAASAGADDTGQPGPTGCSDGKPWYRVSQVGPESYQAIGDPVGKYNASSVTTKLTFEMTVTKSKQTTWEVSAGGSLSWGIAQVEAKTSYNVSNGTTVGKRLIEEMAVPAKKRGYIAPKVEYRTFNVDQMKTVAPCKDVFIKRMGKLRAITANPFFSECIATTACTPRP